MRVLKYYVENKALFDNEINENKVLYFKALWCETIKNNKNVFSFMLYLQTYYHFKLDFQTVDQHTGGKWLIHGTKRHKDNQLQSLAWNSPVEYPSRDCKHDIKESKGNMLNPIFNESVQGQKHPGSCAFEEPELLW